MLRRTRGRDRVVDCGAPSVVVVSGSARACICASVASSRFSAVDVVGVFRGCVRLGRAGRDCGSSALRTAVILDGSRSRRRAQRFRRRFAENRSLSVASASACSTREAEHARRVAHRAAPAPGDLLAHHRRVLAPVPLVDVLQHALALAVREVDVDVRRLLPLLAQEALEQQFQLTGSTAVMPRQ